LPSRGKLKTACAKNFLLAEESVRFKSMQQRWGRSRDAGEVVGLCVANGKLSADEFGGGE
jgi:hypothetical protein